MTTQNPPPSLGAPTAGEKSFRPPPPDPLRRRFRGCLLGGAVGDALGAPVEFMSLEEIRGRFGPGGIVDYTTAFERQGAITDDTQMSLFTADGLLRAHVKSAVEGNANLPADRGARLPALAGHAGRVRAADRRGRRRVDRGRRGASRTARPRATPASRPSPRCLRSARGPATTARAAAA